MNAAQTDWRPVILMVAVSLTVGAVIVAEGSATPAPTPAPTVTITAPPVTETVTVRVTQRASRAEVRSPQPISRPDTSGVEVVRDPNTPAIWKRIAQCESGGRLHAVSPSGKYLGLYQLHRGFFITHGYRGDAWKSLTAAEQLRIAEYVQARQGWKAWPVCSRKAGAR